MVKETMLRERERQREREEGKEGRRKEDAGEVRRGTRWEEEEEKGWKRRRNRRRRGGAVKQCEAVG